MPKNVNIQEQAEGWDAAERGDSVDACPYQLEDGKKVQRWDWLTGWRDQQHDAAHRIMEAARDMEQDEVAKLDAYNKAQAEREAAAKPADSAPESGQG